MRGEAGGVKDTRRPRHHRATERVQPGTFTCDDSPDLVHVPLHPSPCLDRVGLAVEVEDSWRGQAPDPTVAGLPRAACTVAGEAFRTGAAIQAAHGRLPTVPWHRRLWAPPCAPVARRGAGSAAAGGAPARARAGPRRPRFSVLTSAAGGGPPNRDVQLVRGDDSSPLRGESGRVTTTGTGTSMCIRGGGSVELRRFREVWDERSGGEGRIDGSKWRGWRGMSRKGTMIGSDQRNGEG